MDDVQEDELLVSRHVPVPLPVSQKPLQGEMKDKCSAAIGVRWVEGGWVGLGGRYELRGALGRMKSSVRTSSIVMHNLNN